MAKILSVEDDEDIQHLIGRVLFAEGHEMHYAWNGQEGYEKALAVYPDLILLDLVLPVVNGIELMQKLGAHKVAREIPVIIVTAYGDEANMLKYSVEALGAASYLRKPVDFKELSRSVKRVLEGSRRAAAPAPEARALCKGAVRADPMMMTAWVSDRLVATLVDKEFALLRLLISAPGPVSRADLLRGMGYGGDQSNALKQVVHRLRRDFGAAESGRIRTTPGGYELVG